MFGCAFDNRLSATSWILRFEYHGHKLASLPYRFKAGGASSASKMPGPVATGHSHRPTTKVSHKAFKSKHATKSALRDAAKGESHRYPGYPYSYGMATSHNFTCMVTIR